LSTMDLRSGFRLKSLTFYRLWMEKEAPSEGETPSLLGVADPGQGVRGKNWAEEAR